MPVQYTERIVIHAIQGQIVILGIAFQPALPLLVTPNPARYGMHQLRQFPTGGCIQLIGIPPPGGNFIAAPPSQSIQKAQESLTLDKKQLDRGPETMGQNRSIPD